VTCQPIVGLRNRALLGSRPVNKIPRRRDDVTRVFTWLPGDEPPSCQMQQ
jgi:hypothetical protein